MLTVDEINCSCLQGARSWLALIMHAEGNFLYHLHKRIFSCATKTIKESVFGIIVTRGHFDPGLMPVVSSSTSSCVPGSITFHFADPSDIMGRHVITSESIGR